MRFNLFMCLFLGISCFCFCAEENKEEQKKDDKNQKVAEHLGKGIEHATSAAIGLTSAVLAGPKNPKIAFVLCVQAGADGAKAIDEFIAAGKDFWESKDEREQETTMQCWSKD